MNFSEKSSRKLQRGAFARLREVAAAIILFCAPAMAESAPPLQRPVVIELFTSQGCSSCPPADKLMSKIAREPGVFALSLPVDIWDYVGWKDTLALPYHSQRQRQYAKGRGDNRVYTPQAVVNGIAHVVGSDPAALQASADDCYGREGALRVDLKAEPVAGGLKVAVGAAPEGVPKAAILWLVRVASERDVQIKRGENSGQRSPTSTSRADSCASANGRAKPPRSRSRPIN